MNAPQRRIPQPPLTLSDVADIQPASICERLGPMTKREALQLRFTAALISEPFQKALHQQKDLIATLAAKVDELRDRVKSQESHLAAQQQLIAQLQNQLSGHKRNLERLNSSAKSETV